MSSTPENDRRHLRYSGPQQQVFSLIFVAPDGTEAGVSALIVNESHQGFACVVVGPPPDADLRFFHQENEKIRTPLVLRHHQELAATIRILGFERSDAVIRT